MTLISRIAILLLAFAGPAWAGGEWRGSEKDPFITREGPLAYANGCYWHRGVRYCSSYCYMEVNGRYYCQSRESEAVPQGRLDSHERPTVREIYRYPRRPYYY